MLSVPALSGPAHAAAVPQVFPAAGDGVVSAWEPPKQRKRDVQVPSLVRRARRSHSGICTPGIYMVWFLLLVLRV